MVDGHLTGLFRVVEPGVEPAPKNDEYATAGPPTERLAKGSRGGRHQRSDCLIDYCWGGSTLGRMDWRWLLLLSVLFGTAVIGCGDGDASREVVADQEPLRDEEDLTEILGGGSFLAARTPAGLFVYSTELQANGSLGEGEIQGDAVLASIDGRQVRDVTEPFADPFDPHSVVAAVGTEVFQFGERCAERVTSDDSAFCEPGGFQAAVLSTQTEQWRPIDVPPELQGAGSPGRPSITSLVGVAANGVVIMHVVPEGNPEVGSAPIWGYDVSAGEWHHYPDPGVAVFGYCLADDQIVVSTAVENAGVDANVTGVELRVVSVHERAQGWEAPFPVLDQRWDYVPYLGCADGVIATWGDARHVEGVDEYVAYRLGVSPGAQWERVDNLPSDFLVDGYLSATDTVIVLGDSGGGLVLDGTTWNALETPGWTAESVRLWDGERVVVVDPAAPDPISSVEVPR